MLILQYQEHYDAISTMIRVSCEQHLDAGFKALCFHALDKLSRKRPFPFTKGRDNTWIREEV